MAASFEIYVTDAFGTPLFPLTAIYSFQYGRGTGTVGEGRLLLPTAAYNRSLFRPWQRIVVQRSLPGLQPYVDMQTIWFVQAIHDQLLRDGQTFYQLDVKDTNFVLDGPVIPYNLGNTFTDKVLAADDMLKQVVSENLGAGASDASRNIGAYLTIAGNASLAPILRHQFRNEGMLAQLVEICQESYQLGTYLTFDVVPTDMVTGTLQFQTFVGQRGIDHRFPGGNPPVLLDPQMGNQSEVDLALDYTNMRNFAYVGGQSILGLRPEYTASDPVTIGLGPFARREIWVNGKSQDDPTALQNQANAAVRANRAVLTFTGRVVEQPNSLRGVQWDYGDLVTFNYKNQSYDVVVEKLVVTLQANGADVTETADVQFRTLV